MQAKIFKSIMLVAMMLTFFTACRKALLPDEALKQNTIDEKAAIPPGQVGNDMVMHWNDITNQVLNRPETPPAHMRFFAMVSIAVHDAMNSIVPRYKRYALQAPRNKDANPNAAVASAAYHTLKGLGFTIAQPLDDWYQQSLAGVTGPGKDEGITLGQLAAAAILAERSDDNFAIANQQLPQPDGVLPGEYKSTLPFSLPGFPKIKALHQWGSVMKPFVMTSNNQFRAIPPDAITSAAYTADYNEVKLKGAMVGHNRTADESEIGVFWVERSSLGWNRMARAMINSKKIDPWRTARLFALLHTAMADAATASFESKYYYKYWRPETAIRTGNADGNDQTVGDPTWLNSYVNGPNPANPALNVTVPPIPDYPSLHANSGGSAAEILRLFFTSDKLDQTLTSTALPGATRYYSTLSQAARDNSLSRIYVGFHFRKACIQGELQGKDVAAFVFANAFGDSD